MAQRDALIKELEQGIERLKRKNMTAHLNPKKKRTRKPVTPRSKVRAALRMLWLTSRERAQAMKDAKYTCACCGVKQSRASGREIYVEAHHQDGIGNWEELIDMFYTELLCEPDKITILCKKCHEEI